MQNISKQCLSSPPTMGPWGPLRSMTKIEPSQRAWQVKVCLCPSTVEYSGPSTTNSSSELWMLGFAAGIGQGWKNLQHGHNITRTTHTATWNKITVRCTKECKRIEVKSMLQTEIGASLMSPSIVWLQNLILSCRSHCNFKSPYVLRVSCQPGKQYRKVTKCYNCPNFETSVTSCHLSNAQNGWTMIHEDEQMELWNFFILKHATSTSLVLVLLELPAGPWCLRSCETLHVRNPHLFPCGQRFAWQIYNHNHVKYVKYCQIMYLDLFGYTPHLYIRILMSSLGFSYILVTCIPGDKHFSSQGVNTISQVSIFCTPSLKNSSKPDRERQLAGVWKCRVLYIVIFMWTSTNTNMEMSCLHQYRIQKGVQHDATIQYLFLL